MKVAGIILAAGESSRMGFPKALLPYDGRTFLAHLAETFAAVCDPVIAVVGTAAERIERESGARVTFVRNPDPTRGQISSLQCGLAATPGAAVGALFTLVDHPRVAVSTLRALPGESIAIPRYRGQRGHPVFLPRARFADMLTTAGSARDVIEAHPVRYVDVDDPGVVDDIDDPAAYRRLTGRSVA